MRVFAPLAALLLPTALAAQALCSAPHSSPTLAGGGSIETLGPGAGWIQVSLSRQVSKEFFNPVAERQAFLSNGQVRTQSIYFTGAVGVVRGVDVWLQLPLHDVRYADATGTRQSRGLGDPRFSVRIGPDAVGGPSVPIAVRAGVKFPGSRFPVDATIIPLGEGQRDIELSVESGAAIGQLPVYVLGWVGRRWRAENPEASRKPGDEWFGHMAVGGALGPLGVEVAAEYLHGDAPRFLGFEVVGARRRIIQLQSRMSYTVGRAALDLDVLAPVGGRNVPTGPSVGAGVRLAWGTP